MALIMDRNLIAQELREIYLLCLGSEYWKHDPEILWRNLEHLANMSSSLYEHVTGESISLLEEPDQMEASAA